MTYKILNLKSWVITLTIVLIFFLGNFINLREDYIRILRILILFTYSYIVNINIYKLVPEKLKIDITTFKYVFWIGSTITFFLPILRNEIVYILYSYNVHGFIREVLINISPFISLISCIYIIIFSAKLLVTIELRRTAIFSDYFKTLLLYFIFPVSLLFTHDRIRKIINNLKKDSN